MNLRIVLEHKKKFYALEKLITDPFDSNVKMLKRCIKTAL